MCKRLFLLVSFVLVLTLAGNASAVIYSEDVGDTAIAGSSSYDDVNDVWTVLADGADIWGAADAFHYVFQRVSGDCVLEADVNSLIETDYWVKAGVMVRESLAAGSKHAIMAATPHLISLQWRFGTDGGSSNSDVGGFAVPVKIRITRNSATNNLTGEYYKELIPGVWAWEPVTTINVPMSNDVLIGLAVTSHTEGALTTAVFKDVVWTVTPSPRAWNPSPANGAKGLPVDTTVSWRAGEDSNSYNVYFDLDADGVLDDCGNQAGTTFDPGLLQEGKVYIWRIDAVEADDITVHEGEEWSFKTERAGTGSILYELWWNIGGGTVPELTGDPRYPANPDESYELPSLEVPMDIGDNYGARMIGYLHPETPGDYTFWIASDDDSELWLSTSESPCDARKIASVSGWTCSRCWDWQDTQTSDYYVGGPIPLEGDQRYYISALFKEGGGGDNCAVGWQTPDNPSIEVIDGYYLSPDYVDYWAGTPSPASELTVAIGEYPSLGWSAAAYADSYKVYLGTDPEAMALIYSGEETSCDPGPLEETTYYWRVDPVTGDDVTVGCVWNFTTVEWMHLDIGNAWGGSSTYDDVNDAWTVTGDGSDIWNGSDNFHYVYKVPELTRGDCTVTAKVASIEGGTNDWRKASVMIRDSRAASSFHANMALTTGPSHGLSFQYREVVGDSDGEHGVQPPNPFAPFWVRVTREGDTFTGYHSPDGETWTMVDPSGDEADASNPVDIIMSGPVLVGMAVTSHDEGQLTTAVFEEFSIETPDPRKAWDPSPRNGAEGVPIDPILSWGMGEDAILHFVSFSDNYDDVADVTVLDIVEEPNYDPGILDLTKTYYWAVHEVWQDGIDMGVTMGDIWSFTISDHRLIDDFEAYEVIPEAPPEQEIIDGNYTIPGYTIYSVEPNDDCLLADYQFEGDANDSSGNGRHGTLIGDANVATGVLEVDGDGDCVNIGDDPNFNPAGSFSISVWANILGEGDCWGNVIVGKRGDGGVGWQLRRHGCDAVVSFTTRGIGNDDAKGRIEPSPGEWHHIAAIYDGSKKVVYIDGELDVSYAASGTITPCDHNVYIGARANGDNTGPESFFNGQVDDLQLYCRALSLGEVRYINGLPDLVIDPIYVPPVYGPLLAEYLFDSDDANDTSGNNLHGDMLADASIIDDAVRGLVASFDGDGDCIDLGNDPNFNPGTGPFSISTWINMSSYGGNWANVIVGKRGEGGQGWQLRRLAGEQRISFTTRNCGDQDGWGDGGQNVSLNEWHHVVAVRDGTQKWLYIDLEKEAVSGICDYIQECDHNVYIGARAAGNNNPEGFFNGMIDDLRYYKDYALSYYEVLALSEFDLTNPIYDTWEDRYAVDSVLEWESSHWGEQAMRVDCNGDGYVRRTPPFEDWTLGNSKALVLYFKGDPGNVLEDMYVRLQSDWWKWPPVVRIHYDGDMNDLNVEDWTEWNIDLQEVEEHGTVTLEDISKVGIGLSGTGTVYVDDLRLVTSRCVAMYGPSADLTGDCFVDYREIRILAGEWLEGDYTISPTAPTTGLVALYEFEGDANDSSGNDHHGTLVGDISFEDDRGGQVVDLPGGDDQFVEIGAVGISGNDPTTIACWAKADHTNIPDWTLVFGFSTPGGGCGSHFNIGSIGGPGGVGAHAWCFEETIFTDDEALEWRHYAMTFDGTTIKHYGDGLQTGQADMDLSIRGDYVNIGKRNTQASSFPGNVDDACIYNYALSYGEVRYLAGVGDMYIPLEATANLYNEEADNFKKVNFKDYAVMADQWLYEQLWP